jgi:hypothetical protein
MNQTLFTQIHSLLRWGVVLFGLWAVINALIGVISKRNYGLSDNRSSLLFMIFCDIQLLIGLLLYFNGAWFDMLKTNAGAVMKDSYNRFFAMEHAVMMIIAWLLIHIGRSLVKKTDSNTQKHKRSLLYFGIAFIIILAMIPWPIREIVARPWFPKF